MATINLSPGNALRVRQDHRGRWFNDSDNANCTVTAIWLTAVRYDDATGLIEGNLVQTARLGWCRLSWDEAA